jgi:hypothetical protein
LPLLVMAAASMNALLDKALDDVSKVMQHGFDPKVVKKVQDLIDMDDGKTAVNTIWQDVQEVFKQEGIGDIDAYVRVETLIFHISNRGGLGGSAHDAQKNGDSIIEKGADPKKLADAVCIDLCPIEPLRSLQIKFMQNLVDRSKGMFAPVGKAEVGTLGCGHFGQFAKATNNGCKSVFSRLSDERGNLDKDAMFKKDKRFQKLCDGYPQLRLPFGVQLAWRRLPDIIQRACNASNLVASHPNELETAVSILSYVGDMPEGEIDWAAAKQSVRQSSACDKYMDVVELLCKDYAWGKFAPYVMMTSSYAKRLGATSLMGQRVTEALVADPCNALHPRVRVRWAIVHAIITSGAVVDGVFDFAEPGAVRKVVATTAGDPDAAEKSLHQAEDWVQKLKGNIIPDVDLDNVLGCFYTRSGYTSSKKVPTASTNASTKTSQMSKVCSLWTLATSLRSSSQRKRVWPHLVRGQPSMRGAPCAQFRQLNLMSSQIEMRSKTKPSKL